MAWPPTLDELKEDLGEQYQPGVEDRDDARLTQTLDAAIVFVESVRPQFNYTGDPFSLELAPTADVVLGTLRLAGRWHTRRRSPDGLLAMAELGSARVPSFDPDIEKLLRIGRWAKALVA